MKFFLLKDQTVFCRKLSIAACVLSMALILFASVEATPRAGGPGNERDTSPASVLVPEALEGAIEKVWITYGVRVKGVLGLRIHTKFWVKNALNVGCSIQATVERADGKSMLSKSVGTVYQDGKKVLVLSTFTPPYDPATYPDTKLFIPYWALNLQAQNPNKMKLNIVLVGEAKQFARSSMDFGVPLGKGL